MPTASESRAALTLVADEAVAAVLQLVRRGASRGELLEDVPGVLEYYALGTSALAADFYDEEREQAHARGRYRAEPVILDRMEKIGRAVAWATAPLLDDDNATTSSRLAEVIQLEAARPYRDTILTNQERDPAAVGWRRITRGDGCKLCRMLAARGAVYRQSTARFAAHGHCNCSAAPVFDGQDGEEASALQYVASRRRTSAKDRERLRTYLNENYPDAPG